MKYTTEQFKKMLVWESNVSTGHKEVKTIKGKQYTYYYGKKDQCYFKPTFHINHHLACEADYAVIPNTYRYNEIKDTIQKKTFDMKTDTYTWKDVPEKEEDLYFETIGDVSLYQKFYIGEHKDEYFEAIRKSIENKKTAMSRINEEIEKLQNLLISEGGSL